MEENTNTQIENGKPQGWRIGLVIATGIISIIYAQMICPNIIIMPLFPHMYEYMASMPTDPKGIIIFMGEWMANSIATIPSYIVGQVYSITFFVEIILMIVGASSKNIETKRKMTKSIMVAMVIKIILAYLFTLGEFVTGMLFLIFPRMNNIVSYQHWPILCTIEAVVMLLGAAAVTAVYFVLKLSKK